MDRFPCQLVCESKPPGPGCYFLEALVGLLGLHLQTGRLQEQCTAAYLKERAAPAVLQCYLVTMQLDKSLFTITKVRSRNSPNSKLGLLFLVFLVATLL